MEVDEMTNTQTATWTYKPSTGADWGYRLTGPDASATLAVGDTVEIVGPNCISGTGTIGETGVVVDGPAECTKTTRYSVASESYPRGGMWYDASSLRRVQPAPDVQPAAGYIAGQAVEVHMGQRGHIIAGPNAAGQYALTLDGKDVSYQFRAESIRPCPAGAGCVVMNRDGDARAFVIRRHEGLVVVTDTGAEFPFAATDWPYVMLVPRPPAAPAEQPVPPSRAQQIDAVLKFKDGETVDAAWVRRGDAIRAAAAVPPDATAADVHDAILKALGGSNG